MSLHFSMAIICICIYNLYLYSYSYSLNTQSVLGLGFLDFHPVVLDLYIRIFIFLLFPIFPGRPPCALELGPNWSWFPGHGEGGGGEEWEKVNGKCHVSQASKRHTPKSALIGFFFAITEISSMSIIVTLAMSVVSLVLKIAT